jgi:phage terminase large subunit-like protein
MPTPRGNGKSTLGGGVAAWATFDENEADSTGAPQVPIIATTVGQAIRSVYGVAASMIRHEPQLADRCIEFTGIATPRIYVPRTEASMFPVSQELPGLQGLDPSFAVVDELGFLLPEVWAALVLAAGKRAR